MVDNYVYFANTFVDYTTLTGNVNTENTVEHNSLNRVKTNEYGHVTKDKDDVIENTEVVYSKISGFNNSNMFVVGNYMYYTSPNAHKDKNGNDLFDKTTLFRMKLDGTSNTEVFSTQTSQGKFYLVTGQTNYLLILDNNKILKLEIGETVGQVEELATDVLDTVFPKEYGALNTIYYTKDINAQDKAVGLTGNLLYKLDLATGTSTPTGKPQAHTLTFVAYENNVLYYKKAINKEVLYYSNTLQNGFEASEKQLTYVVEQEGSETTITDFSVINQNNYCFEYNKKIMLNTSTTPLVAADSYTATYPAGVVGNTMDNLLAAAKGENEEWDVLYKEFAEVASEEGFPAIAATYKNIAKVEAEHERRYLKLLSRLSDGDFFKRDGKIWWQCRNCGYIVEAEAAPKTCPACLFPQAYFEPMKENY